MNPDLPPLIQQMLCSGFYDHDVVEPIEVIQTHISFVLLTGEYVYKIKKAVSFGFLDFSTLALRQHFCQEELRLNRRLSPQLYLEVVSISQQQGHYSLGADSPVEYAVKMRQFPQSELFSALFKSQALGEGDLRALAQQLAVFHQRAPATSKIRSFGELEQVRKIHRGNENICQGYLGRTLQPHQFERLQTYAESIFRDHPHWFEARLALNRIRECHGDLHLNNVCRFQGQVQVFDCIEFNQEFRNIDVFYDAAFMVMDLEFLGRSDFAFLFLNEYLELTADYDGLKLLPLYLMMRAMIRGNVISLALEDKAIAPQEKDALEQKAIAYYQLAEQYTQPSQGQIVMMSGLSGSGKSTVAKLLAQSTRGIYLRSDAMRKHISGLSLVDHSSDIQLSELYSQERTQQTYDALLAQGLELAQEGWVVILDATYSRQCDREDVIRAVQTQQIPFQIVQCIAPVEELKRRLRSRQGDLSDANESVLEGQLQTYEAFGKLEQAYLTVIDTASLSLGDIQSQVLSLIEE